MAFLSLFVGAGAAGFSFSVFLPIMGADLGWPRSTLVGATSVAWVAASVAGPWIGRIVDRHGARVVLALSVLGTGLSAVGSSWVQQPWQFYLSFGVLGGISRSALLNVAPGTMVANWFQRRRAFALSFAALGPPASSLVFPPVTALVIAASDWRTGWTALGVAVVVIALAPMLLLVRRRPEDMGLLPDGEPPDVPASSSTVSSSAIPKHEDDWTMDEALHSHGFWMLAVSMALIGLAPSAAVIFLFSYFRDQGMPEAVAATTISVLSVVQVLSRVGFWSPVIARLGSVQRVLPLWGVLLMVSTLFLTLAHSQPMAYVASAFLGFAMGGNLVLQMQIWPEYFGRTAVGAITGVAQGMQGLSSAGGPLLGAALLDATGNYTWFYLMVAGVVLVGLLLQLMVGKPRKPARHLLGDA